MLKLILIVTLITTNVFSSKYHRRSRHRGPDRPDYSSPNRQSMGPQNERPDYSSPYGQSMGPPNERPDYSSPHGQSMGPQNERPDYSSEQSMGPESDNKNLDALLAENLEPFKMPHNKYEAGACDHFCKAFGMLVAKNNDDYKMHYTVCNNYCTGDTHYDRNVVLKCRKQASEAFQKTLDMSCRLKEGCSESRSRIRVFRSKHYNDIMHKECISTCDVTVAIYMTRGTPQESSRYVDSYKFACSKDCLKVANQLGTGGLENGLIFYEDFKNNIQIFKAEYNKCWGFLPPNGVGPIPLRSPFWPGPEWSFREACDSYCDKIAHHAFKKFELISGYSSHCNEYCKDEVFYDDYHHWKIQTFEDCRQQMIPRATSQFDQLCKIAEGVSSIANCDKQRYQTLSCSNDCNVTCYIKANLFIGDEALQRKQIYESDCCHECTAKVNTEGPKLFIDKINEDIVPELEACYSKRDERDEAHWW